MKISCRYEIIICPECVITVCQPTGKRRQQCFPAAFPRRSHRIDLRDSELWVGGSGGEIWLEVEPRSAVVRAPASVFLSNKFHLKCYSALLNLS